MKKNLAVTIAMLLLAPAAALAQEAPAPAPAPAPAATPAPAPAPAPVAEPAPMAEPMAEPMPMAEPEPMPPAADTSTEAEPAAEEEEDGGIPGWFRIDTDGLSTQLWVGATHDLGGVSLATDIYVVGVEAELDIGIAFNIGPVALLPMAGIVFDFGTQDVDGLVVPQLFTIIDTDMVYFESWIQLFLNGMFNEEDIDTTGDGMADTTVKEYDTFYTRNFLLFKVSEDVAIGPNIELSAAVAGDKPLNADGEEATLYSLPIGGAFMLNYGENNTLLLALGFDVKAEDMGGDDAGQLAGRFTFIRTW